MSPIIKIVIVLVPFIIAAYVGFSMLQPAMDEATTKEASVTEKRTEAETLQSKLSGEARASKRKAELEKELSSLRESVPKTPETDLFTIDLEKMCKDAGMDLISIGAPNKDNAAPAAEDKSSYLKKKQDRLKNALKGGATADAKDAAEEDSEPPAPELEETQKQIVVTGDYNGLQKLVHELESYQRVIKINQITSRVPKKETSPTKDAPVKLPDDAAPGEADQLGNPNMLYIAIDLTTYYLP